jgi:hypothetical protein
MGRVRPFSHDSVAGEGVAGCPSPALLGAVAGGWRAPPTYGLRVPNGPWLREGVDGVQDSCLWRNVGIPGRLRVFGVPVRGRAGGVGAAGRGQDSSCSSFPCIEKLEQLESWRLGSGTAPAMRGGSDAGPVSGSGDGCAHGGLTMGERDLGEGQDQGREPIEVAQAYVNERYAGADTGWRVEELAGDVNFGMVTVVIGRYLPSGDIEKRVDGVEGHGTTIEAAVDDALGQEAG